MKKWLRDKLNSASNVEMHTSDELPEHIQEDINRAMKSFVALAKSGGAEGVEMIAKNAGGETWHFSAHKHESDES